MARTVARTAPPVQRHARVATRQGLSAAQRGERHARRVQSHRRRVTAKKARQRRNTVFGQRIGSVGVGSRRVEAARSALVRALQQMPDVQRHNLNLNRLLQREQPAYRRYTQRSFSSLVRSGLLPPGSPHPHVRFAHPQTLRTGERVFGNYPYAAYVPVGSRRITVSPDAVHRMFDHTPANDRRARLYFRQVPLHEIAHTLQRDELSDREAEGGAEAFKAFAARELGMERVYAPAYVPAAQKAVRRGSSYVTRGQFRRRRKPRRRKVRFR